MSYKKSNIKKQEVLVDRDIGEAYVEITLYARNRKDYPCKITHKEVKEFATLGGAEVLEVLSGPTALSNRYEEVTGKWTVKIPTKDPENSTTAILKRRQRKKTKASKNSK